MRKGELKKQEMLDAAERYFCAKGFEETSVQDIIDATNSSKGGFYHYFPSKESVLDVLCQQHAQKSAEECTKELEQLTDPLERLNLVLSMAMPVQGSAKSFLLMLLPVIEKPEGFSVLIRYQQEHTNVFTPILMQEVDTCRRAEVIYPVAKQVAAPVLVLLGACWREALSLVVTGSKVPGLFDSATLSELLTGYRKIITAILDAPYGSLDLADVGTWSELLGDMMDARKHIEKIK